MTALKTIKKGLDRTLLITALTMLSVMVLIIIVQVFSRQLFSHTPSWSTEISKVLFVWVGFLGIAYGVRQKLHIGMQVVVNALPEKIQDAFDYFAKVLVLLFGIVMVYYGYEFTVLTHSSTMPGSGLPSNYLYASIPVSGVFVVLYAIELMFVKGMHQDYSGEAEGL